MAYWRKISGFLGGSWYPFSYVLALAIPSFWVGLLLLYLFGVKLQLVSVTNTKGFAAYVLPAVTLALWLCGLYIRRLRNAILEVSRRPFVQGARALGLPEWMVYTRYIFPHVGLMLLPMMGVTMGAMLGGSAVIEMVFAIKGFGYMMVQGIVAPRLCFDARLHYLDYYGVYRD